MQVILNAFRGSEEQNVFSVFQHNLEEKTVYYNNFDRYVVN